MTCLDLVELCGRWQVSVGDKSLLGTQKPTVGSGSSTTKTALRGDLLPSHSLPTFPNSWVHWSALFPSQSRHFLR